MVHVRANTHFYLYIYIYIYIYIYYISFTSPGDETSEVVSRCLPHRQLWVSNLSKVATQWLEVDSNPRLFGCKAQNNRKVAGKYVCLRVHYGLQHIGKCIHSCVHTCL